MCGWDAVNEVVGRPEDFSSNLTATMTYQDGKVGASQWANSAATSKRWQRRTTPLMPPTESCWCRSWQGNESVHWNLFVAETEDRLWNEGVQSGGIEWMSAMANRLPMMIVTRLIGVPDLDTERGDAVGVRKHQSG